MVVLQVEGGALQIGLGLESGGAHQTVGTVALVNAVQVALLRDGVELSVAVAGHGDGLYVYAGYCGTRQVAVVDGAELEAGSVEGAEHTIYGVGGGVDGGTAGYQFPLSADVDAFLVDAQPVVGVILEVEGIEAAPGVHVVLYAVEHIVQEGTASIGIQLIVGEERTGAYLVTVYAERVETIVGGIFLPVVAVDDISPQMGARCGGGQQPRLGCLAGLGQADGHAGPVRGLQRGGVSFRREGGDVEEGQ